MHQNYRRAFLVTTLQAFVSPKPLYVTLKGKVNKLIHNPIIAQLNSFRNSD